MDDIGNWLYIIVLIIAGISGLFGSGKKKKQSMDIPEYEEDDTIQPSDDKGFWDLFDEVMNEPKKQREPEKKVIVPPIQSKPTVITKPQSSSVNRFSNVTVSSQEEMGSILNENDNIDDHYLLENEDFHDISELRKAIIYTEILNRKY